MITKRNSIDMTEINTKMIYDGEREPDREFKRGDFLRHYNGAICQFVGYARNTETRNTDLKDNVAIYEILNNNDRELVATPIELFLGKLASDEPRICGQEYRVVKVMLEKKSAKNTIISTTVTSENDIQLLYSVREFLRRCNHNKHERIQYWTTPILNSPGSMVLRCDRPLGKQTFLSAIKGDANIHHQSGNVKTILNPAPSCGRVIQFQTDSAVETILHGDILHFVDDNRMVVENKINKMYEFFEIVPIVDESA